MEVNDPNIRSMERRSFLTLSAGLVSAITFGSVPGFGCADETQFFEGRFGGDKNMGKRVLVTYASKCGSTGGVADAIGKGCAAKACCSLRSPRSRPLYVTLVHSVRIQIKFAGSMKKV